MGARDSFRDSTFYASSLSTLPQASPTITKKDEPISRRKGIGMETVEAMSIFVGRDAAAAAISVSLPTLDRLIRDGRVEVARVGRRILVRRESLERLAERANG